MRMTVHSWVLGIVTVLLTALPGRADFVWEFADSLGTPTSSFTISNIGNTVDVRVYLKEFGSNPGNVLASEGLFGVGIRLDFDSPGGIAAVLSTSDIIANDGVGKFDDTASQKKIVNNPVANTARLLEISSTLPGVSPEGTGALNRILVGTFRFTGQANGSVTVLAQDYAGTDDTVTGTTFMVLDGLIGQSTATITVGQAAIPEPGSLALCGLAGIGGAFGVWRRRRAQKA